MVPWLTEMRSRLRLRREVLALVTGFLAAGALALTPGQAWAQDTHAGGGNTGNSGNSGGSDRKNKQAKPGEADVPDKVGGMVCPTRDFWIGDGFGADRGNRKHMGLDLGGDRGLPIFAVEDGRIDRTKRQDNDALQIVMRGVSGSKFYYGHMDEVFVKGGQRVEAGEVIGTMGDTGSPGAVHLHFEYWKSGGESDAIDPRPLIERICKR